jgi:hypothetical protein
LSTSHKAGIMPLLAMLTHETTSLILTRLYCLQLFFGSTDVKQQLPMNGVGSSGAIEWETDLFVGRTWVHIRGLPTTQQSKFEGKKRLFHIVTQVRNCASGPAEEQEQQRRRQQLAAMRITTPPAFNQGQQLL